MLTAYQTGQCNHLFLNLNGLRASAFLGHLSVRSHSRVLIHVVDDVLMQRLRKLPAHLSDDEPLLI